MEIKAGDIVYLNSGSPELEVFSVLDGKAWVKWRRSDGGREMHMFPTVCLTHERRDVEAAWYGHSN